jgi:pimeloyl-ACP methyl ester carboxylesterase
MKASSPRLQRGTTTVCGWPSDSFSVDYYVPWHDDVVIDTPHTVLVFVPGNPGLIEWYLSLLQQLITRLGPGFAARGIGHAGHSLHPERIATVSRCTDVPWTVDGQSMHKAAYVDLVIKEFRQIAQIRGVVRQPKLIFVCHSVGTFFTQQLLMRRADILARTDLLIGLMPFIRMNAPWKKQIMMDTLAAYPTATIRVHEFLSLWLSKLPRSWVDRIMRFSIPDPTARSVAIELACQYHFVRNFFSLGLEEIRDLPETVNAAPFRQCPTALLFAGNDQWAPEHHLDDLQRLKDSKLIPETVQWEYNPRLRHDFVVDDEQIVAAIDFCEKHIRRIHQKSRL